MSYFKVDFGENLNYFDILEFGLIMTGNAYKNYGKF